MQIGVKELHIARVTKSGALREYGHPIAAAKTIKIDLTTEKIEGSLYSHDELIYHEEEFKQGKIVMNVADLSPEIEKMVLDQEEDADGVMYSGNEDQEDPPVFAVGFLAAKGGGKNRYLWLFEVSFNKPSEEYETKKDGINIITPIIEGKFVKRPDGRWKADYVGLPTDAISEGWFDEVREFEDATRVFDENGYLITDENGNAITIEEE